VAAGRRHIARRPADSREHELDRPRRLVARHLARQPDGEAGAPAEGGRLARAARHRHARHDWGRRHRVHRAQAHRARRGKRRGAAGRSRPEDDRQRPRPATRHLDVRIPDGPRSGRGPRDEPEGRRADHRALVLRGGDGAQGGPPCAGDRQGGRRDRDDHPRRVSWPAHPACHDRRHSRRRGRQTSGPWPSGRRCRTGRRAGGDRSRRRPGRRGDSRAGRPRQPAPRRGGLRRRGQSARAPAPTRDEPDADDRHEEHRLRAPLRRPNSVRPGVYARPRLLGRPARHRGRYKYAHLDPARALRARAARELDGPHDGADAGADGRRGRRPIPRRARVHNAPSTLREGS